MAPVKPQVFNYNYVIIRAYDKIRLILILMVSNDNDDNRDTYVYFSEEIVH